MRCALCVSQGVVADTVVPLIGRQLAEHCGGTTAISIIHDFHHYLHFLTICSSTPKSLFLLQIKILVAT